MTINPIDQNHFITLKNLGFKFSVGVYTHNNNLPMFTSEFPIYTEEKEIEIWAKNGLVSYLKNKFKEAEVCLN